MVSLLDLITAVSVSLLTYTLMSYATLPAKFQNFLDWGQTEIKLDTLTYQVSPVKFILVTLLLVMITESLIIGSLISFFIYVNLATIQAWIRPKLIEIVPLVPLVPLVPVVQPDSLVNPESVATQTLEADLNRDPEPTVLTAPPGGHQGISPVAGAIQTLGQGDPSIGHWNPYINR